TRSKSSKRTRSADRALRAPVAIEDSFAKTNGVGGDLDDLVLIDPVERALDRELLRRGEHDVLVTPGRSDVRELFLAHDVDVEVGGAVVLADDHSLVHRRTRDDEELSAGLEVEQSVGRGGSFAVGDERAVLPAEHRPCVRLPALEKGVQEA